MNHTTTVALFIVGGLAFGSVIAMVARRGHLTMRYTLGWFFVGLCIMIGGISSGLVGPLASYLSISPDTLVLALAAIALLALTVQLSISVSGLLEQCRTLAEGQALLEERVRQLSGETDAKPASGAASR
jgi:hypothetical protein